MVQKLSGSSAGTARNVPAPVGAAARSVPSRSSIAWLDRRRRTGTRKPGSLRGPETRETARPENKGRYGCPEPSRAEPIRSCLTALYSVTRQTLDHGYLGHSSCLLCAHQPVTETVCRTCPGDFAIHSKSAAERGRGAGRATRRCTSRVGRVAESRRGRATRRPCVALPAGRELRAQAGLRNSSESDRPSREPVAGNPATPQQAPGGGSRSRRRLPVAAGRAAGRYPERRLRTGAATPASGLGTAGRLGPGPAVRRVSRGELALVHALSCNPHGANGPLCTPCLVTPTGQTGVAHRHRATPRAPSERHIRSGHCFHPPTSRLAACGFSVLTACQDRQDGARESRPGEDSDAGGLLAPSRRWSRRGSDSDRIRR